MVLDTRAEVITAFAGQASAAAVPTTVVLDREGRPASRIIGLIDKGILETLNKDGTTIVMVTHDPQKAEQTHRIVRLFDGRQVQ